MSDPLCFIVPGPLCSSNRAMRIVSGRAVKSAEKRRDEQRVASIALAAKMKARWKAPQYASVEIIAINSRLDVDNCCKALLDGMQGVLVEHDSRVWRLLVAKMREKGKPEQYLVTVREMEK